MPATRPDRGCGFYFVRHGETYANACGLRAGGDCDSKLTDRGRKQSFDAARMLAAASAPRPREVVASNMARTLHSARIVSTILELRIKVVPGLEERRLADWNFQTVHSTEHLIAFGHPPFGGESEWRFRRRVTGLFGSDALDYSGWPVIVSSRGVGRQLFQLVGAAPKGGVTNGRIYKFTLVRARPFEIGRVEEVGGKGEWAALRSPGVG